MAKRTVEVIDGFSQVQAYKRAVAKGASVTPARVKPEANANSSTNVGTASSAVGGVRTRVATAGARTMPSASTATVTPVEVTPMKAIGVTVAPKKRIVTCYSCGYSFTATGKLHVPYCPKCKLVLCVDDMIIDGEQTTDIQTIGDVVVKPTAQIKEGLTINGRSVTIGGDVSKCAAVLASEQIILETGAVFSSTVLEKTSVVVAAGAVVNVNEILKCARLTVFGRLSGNVHAKDVVTIMPGGYIVGDVSAQSLVMEFGAGLCGACRIIRQ